MFGSPVPGPVDSSAIMPGKRKTSTGGAAAAAAKVKAQKKAEQPEWINRILTWSLWLQSFSRGV